MLSNQESNDLSELRRNQTGLSDDQCVSLPGSRFELIEHRTEVCQAVYSTIKLTRALFPVYLSGFMHTAENAPTKLLAFYEDLLSHLSKAERIVLTRSPEGRALGFVCGSTITTDLGLLYHLEGIVLDPSIQGQGIGATMLKEELKSTGAQILAFHTQSSYMLKLGQKVSDLSTELATLVARHLPHKNLVSSVDHGRYGDKSLYGDRDRFKEIAIPILKVDQGDALFAAGYIREKI